MNLAGINTFNKLKSKNNFKLNKNSTSFVNFKGNFKKDSVELSNNKIQKDKKETSKQSDTCNSETAFLYDPNIKPQDKYEMAQKCDKLINVGDFCEMMGINPLIFSGFIKSGFVDVVDIEPENNYYRKYAKSAHHKKFVDLSDEENKKNIEIIKEKITSGDVKDCASVSRLFGVNLSCLDELLDKGDIKCFGLNDNTLGFKTASVLIDITDEENIKALKKAKERYDKTHPQKSRFIDCDYIQASYLKTLGFGEISTLRKLVQNGFLKGKIEKTEKDGTVKYRTWISIKTPDFENKMLRTRSMNPDVVDIKQYSKETGISQPKIKKALVDDEMEMIKDYIFDADSQMIFIDKKNKKNQEFVNKLLFEQELTRQFQQQRKSEVVKNLKIYNKDQSLKMKLAWHFCPQTRKTASDMAKSDGKICALLAKESENKELSTIEEMTVNSYRKKMWQEAGVEELSNAIKKANILIELYKLKGIEAFDDVEIRKIFEEY